MKTVRLLYFLGKIVQCACFYRINRHSILTEMLRSAVFEVQLEAWPSELLTMPWVLSLTRNESLLLVDGDNLRGKTKFQVSKEQLFADIISFLSVHKLPNPVYLYFDHGMIQETISIPSSNISVVFAGPSDKADDVIISHIDTFQSQFDKDIVLVTEDNLLRKRCRAQSIGSRKSIKKGKDQSIVASNPRNLFLVTSPAFAEILYGRQYRRTANAIISNYSAVAAELSANARNFVNLALPPVKISPTEAAGSKILLEELDHARNEMRLLSQMRRLQVRVKQSVNHKNRRMAPDEKRVLIERFRILALELLALKEVNEEAISIHSDGLALCLATKHVVERAAKCIEKLRAANRLDTEEGWEREIFAELLRLSLKQNATEEVKKLD